MRPCWIVQSTGSINNKLTFYPFHLFSTKKLTGVGLNIMATTSKEVRALIKEKLANTKRDADGNLLCRRCGKVVPKSHRMVYYNPEDPSQVWGPCCSDECICYTKICSHCNKDFFIDKKLEGSNENEIEYYENGIWLCHNCKDVLESCPVCNAKGVLKDTPDGTRICESCFNTLYFTCSICREPHKKTEHISTVYERSFLASYNHVVNASTNCCSSCYEDAISGKEPKEVYACRCCDNFFIKEEGNNYSTEYCSRCFDRGYVKTCDGCGKETHDFDSRGGSVYCRSCIPLLRKCDCCDNWTFKPVHKRINGILYNLCNNCKDYELTTCSTCFYLLPKGVECPKCERYLNRCPTCNTPRFQEEFCRSCTTNKHSKIMNYSYKPHYYFNYKEKNEQVYIGFENEINYADSSDTTLQLQDIYKNYKASELYVKSDGSIRGSGFELVSMPMSYSFFKDFDLSSVFSYTPALNDDSCGLHVHVNKSAFEGDIHLYKFIDFINNNNTFIKKIAGRDFNSYSKKYNNKISNAVAKKHNIERYHAVNITGSKTVEVRIFKRAKNQNQLRYRVEFVFALVEFTRNCSIKENTVSNFVNWVVKGSEYRHLKNFLAEV